MRAFLTCLAVFFATAVSAWDIDTLNERADFNLFDVEGNCSGTLVRVDARLILTARHCVNAKTEVVVTQRFFDAEGKEQSVSYNAAVVAADEGLDVAILRIPEAVGPVVLNIASKSDVPLGAADHMPRRGSVLWHVGNPKGHYGTVTRGIMSSARVPSKNFDGKNRLMIQYDGGLSGGSSGGALYSDDGTFVGIATRVLAAGGNQFGPPVEYGFIGLAVPMSDVWTVAANACIADLLGGKNATKCPTKVAVQP